MTLSRLASLLALALASASVASAEVSAALDLRGNLERIELRTDATGGVVWAKVSDLPDSRILNPLGDRLGDRPPACGILSMPMDDPTGGHLGRGRTAGSPDITWVRSSLVVWSRFDGLDYELVYSLWDPLRRVWTGEDHVSRADNFVDDLRPWLYIGRDRAYLAWRSDGAPMLSTGQVTYRGGVPAMNWSLPLPIQSGLLIDGIDFWQLLRNAGELPRDGGSRP